ncbi:MAG TPA: vWA domain-containing protein [Anaeromyxobacteraceae bacterium]
MRRRSGGRLVWWVLAVTAFVLVVRGIAPVRQARRAAVRPVESPAYYVSEVEEGIGAAVAILVDTSGSMRSAAPGDGRPKHEVARQALEEVVSATDAFVERRPDVPIKLAIYGFASSPWVVYPMQAYAGAAVKQALARLPGPGGGTAIGNALLEARPALYRSGAFRKHIVVITDGENTVGSAPDLVARDIFRKSRGAVSIHFIAFDTSPAHFGFLSDVGGEVLAAQDASSLRLALKQIYEGRILAEAMEYGEAAPPAAAGPRSGQEPVPAPGRTR